MDVQRVLLHDDAPFLETPRRLIGSEFAVLATAPPYTATQDLVHLLRFRRSCADQQAHVTETPSTPITLKHTIAGDGAADTGTCWRADNGTGNRTRALTTSEVNAQLLIAPEAVEAIPELEFDQTANLTEEAGDYQWTSPVGADAEPVPKLEFDQTLGW